MTDRVILHCDLNNFYASAECVMNPALHNYPVAVAGNPKTRHGIILAKNQLAKEKGIKTGQVIWEAKLLCPNLICLPPQMAKYQEFSRQVIEIYKRFTDKIESFGPDECWLDVTHSQKLFGTGEQIANTIRETVKKEIGLTLSVGVSFNKYFAKLGSDMRKPDATTVINRENYKKLIWNMPADVLIFIGKRTYQKLQKLNIHTIQDLALADPNLLTKHFGIIGKKMSVIARGEDDSEIADINDLHTVKSVGNGFTTIRDLHTRDEIYTAVLLLAEKVAFRMRKINVMGRTINLGLKNSDLHWDSHSMTVLNPTNTALEIANFAMQIFDKFWSNTTLSIRSIRVSVSQITTTTNTTQTSFFEDPKMQKFKKLNTTLDKIRDKHGYYAVRPAKTINSDFINYFDASKELGEDYELYDLDEY